MAAHLEKHGVKAEMMEMLAEEMTGLSLLDRPNFKRLATNRRPEARDTDIKLSREIL